ncbi:hypothetical protein [Emticicia fluvialis]|uniref:hypothetical protein n=1 Tax=Emticicia fluvialis TaxID=2974474 RepID=UPI00216537DC|nr:hypothetical protein [Emticicia fluvialis]
MTPFNKILESIENLADDLSALQDPVYIIGSSALVLAGVPLEVTEDLDLLTSARDADFLKNRWQASKIEDYAPKDSDKFRSRFARYQLGGVWVEVMGDLEVCNNNQWQKLRVHQYSELSIGQLKVRIPTLPEQERVFRLFGRSKDIVKADLILKHIIQPDNGN